MSGQKTIDVHCAGLFLFNQKGEMVFVRKKHHGHVSFPKGRMEDDETPLECAIFKARDEAGVYQNELQLILPYAVFDYCRPSAQGLKHLTVYAASTGVVQLNPESNKYEAWWASRKQVAELFYRDDRKAARNAFDQFANRQPTGAAIEK